jgi:group I intron endonuclease
MKPGIYKIISPSGKIYVGQTIDLDRRQTEYKRLQCIKQRKIYYSLSKYGWDNHLWIEIECDITKLDELEVQFKQDIINEYGWGKALFCELHDSGGGPKSENTKKKIGMANKGKHTFTPEQKKQRLTKWKKTLKSKGGFTWGDKISKSQKGVPKPKKWKPVHQYDLEGNFIKEWESISSAEQYYSNDPGKDNIGACTRGKQETAYGYIWKKSNM